MNKTSTGPISFVSLQLRGHGIFQDGGEIIFGRRRTVIAGGGGSGKTTIVRALAGLGAEVTVIGDRKFLRKHSRLVFLDERFLPIVPGKTINPSDGDMLSSAERAETLAMFTEMLAAKPLKARMHRDLNPGPMASGERCCLALASVFAARKTLGLELPIVIDSPFALLDTELKLGVRQFLYRQECQVILLGHEVEFADGEEIDYRLESAASATQVKKVK